jgi:hypothetical protein
MFLGGARIWKRWSMKATRSEAAVTHKVPPLPVLQSRVHLLLLLFSRILLTLFQNLWRTRIVLTHPTAIETLAAVPPVVGLYLKSSIIQLLLVLLALMAYLDHLAIALLAAPATGPSDHLVLGRSTDNIPVEEELEAEDRVVRVSIQGVLEHLLRHKIGKLGDRTLGGWVRSLVR